jgi:hypothetical protein
MSRRPTPFSNNEGEPFIGLPFFYIDGKTFRFDTEMALANTVLQIA